MIFYFFALFVLCYTVSGFDGILQTPFFNLFLRYVFVGGCTMFFIFHFFFPFKIVVFFS